MLRINSIPPTGMKYTQNMNTNKVAFKNTQKPTNDIITEADFKKAYTALMERAYATDSVRSNPITATGAKIKELFGFYQKTDEDDYKKVKKGIALLANA